MFQRRRLDVQAVPLALENRLPCRLGAKACLDFLGRLHAFKTMLLLYLLKLDSILLLLLCSL
jgi:hypothetical protein